ncbi:MULTISPECIES: MFS transporter [unclassified Duganella]|uniref:MFS transporter n=1 Tax=unclassified Duganella TaxID=2636909 RepID=UPI00088AE84A|nr:MULTISPECIES: MFS transporter [unclassified Duganella]SDG24795.1 Predicted arabinose efflux permease, MFS family [Duganella sp. OV458]SDJ23549.1 Predicted arabinose efflux permease, MFS family [Duganella sp. OV510]
MTRDAPPAVVAPSAAQAAVAPCASAVVCEALPAALSGRAVFVLVFLPFALGHFLSCLIRTVNATLAPQLVASLALTPGQLGLLTSAYFLAFALAQLPVGMALDRWGPARVQLPMLLLAGVGALAFAGGQDFAQLLVARALMGLGLGGCFMSAVKAISTWIAPARLPSVQGYLIAVGGLGAAAATLPVRLALQYMDWRALFLWLALAAALTGLLIRALAPQQPLPASQPHPAQQQPLPPSPSHPAQQQPALLQTVLPSPDVRKPAMLAAMREVCRHPAFREVVALVLLPHTVFFGVQGLWIGRWLSDVAGYSEAAVGYLLYLGMAAVIFGAIAVGMLTEWAGRRGVRPISVAAVGVALFVTVQAGFVCDWRPSYPLLSVLFTLVGTVTGIEYAIVAQSLPGALTGRAATCLNLLIFLGAFAVQAGFGLVVGCWRPDWQEHYPPAAYRTAFGALLLLQLPGLVWFVRRRGRNPVEWDSHPTSPR